MSDEPSWFEVVDSKTLVPAELLRQGDLLVDCPRFTVAGLDAWPPTGNEEVQVDTELISAIVLTQTCDLVQKKVEQVLLAAVVPWPTARQSMVAAGNEMAKSRKFRAALRKGNLPALSLLHRRDEAPTLDWSIVDFHQLFTLPKSLVLDVAASAGPRLRLRSPYREHVAQAFARYFMRVGLPHDAAAFEKEG